MADNTNPIKYSDLIAPDNSIEDLIAQLQQLNKVYNDMYKSVTKQAAELANSMKLVSGATEQGRKTTMAASKEADRLAKAEQALRNANDETTQKIQLLKAATAEQMAINKANAKQMMASKGSYDDLSAQYTKNRIELKKLSEEEIKNTKYGQDLQKETKALRERMNELNKATGDFTLQVGNYTIAGDSMREVIAKGRIELIKMEQAGQQNTAAYRQLAENMAQLKDQMMDTDAMIKAMASDTSALDATLQAMSLGTGGFAVVTASMELFGADSKDAEEAQKKLQSAIALVNGVTAIQNALQKQSALVTGLKRLQTFLLSKITKENTATTVANTAAITAQGTATKATTAATNGLGKALKAIKANPVIAAITAIAAITGGVIYLVEKNRSAQRKLYEQQLKNLEVTEAQRKASNLANEKAISDIQQKIKIAQAEGKSESDIIALQEEELKIRASVATKNSAWNKKELANLDANKKKLAENQAILAKGEAKAIKLKDYKKKEIEAENELLERQIQIAEEQLAVNQELQVSEIELAERKRQNAIDIAQAEENSLRELQDARFSLIKNQFAREKTVTKANYDRQIADLKARLVNEKNLTAAERKNIEELTVVLAQNRAAEIKKINQEERAANLASARETQDMWLALQSEGLDKDRQLLLTNYQRETDDLRTKLETDTNLTLQQRQALNVQLYLKYMQYLKDVEKLNDKARADELNAELKAIELRQATRLKISEESIADEKRSIEIRRELALAENKKLAASLRQDEAAINAKFDMEWMQTEDALKREAAEKTLEIQQNLAQSEIDLAIMSDKKKNAEKLKLEKQALEQRLKLNEEANIKMTDEEIKTIENQIAKLEKDIKKEQAPQDLYDLLGLKMDDDQKEAVNQSFEEAKKALADYFDYKNQLAQQSVDMASKEVEAAQNTLNAERQARAAGYANNVAMAEKELAAAKQQQRKALKQQQETQKQQQKLQSIEQAVNMVTASAKVMASIPFPYSLPVLALMWATFIGTKVKAKQLASEQYGEGTVELLQGGSHESGNDIDLGRKKDGTRRRAEGGEFFAVINRRSSRKYRREIPRVINALNDGTFADKYMHAYDAAQTQIISTFEGQAELNSIAKDMRELNERSKKSVVYTADGYIEKRGNITRIVRK